MAPVRSDSDVTETDAKLHWMQKNLFGPFRSPRPCLSPVLALIMLQKARPHPWGFAEV